MQQGIFYRDAIRLGAYLTRRQTDIGKDRVVNQYVRASIEAACYLGRTKWAQEQVRCAVMSRFQSVYPTQAKDSRQSEAVPTTFHQEKSVVALTPYNVLFLFNIRVNCFGGDG